MVPFNFNWINYIFIKRFSMLSTISIKLAVFIFSDSFPYLRYPKVHWIPEATIHICVSEKTFCATRRNCRFLNKQNHENTHKDRLSSITLLFCFVRIEKLGRTPLVRYLLNVIRCRSAASTY